jgi:dephospho-CoA kinase
LIGLTGGIGSGKSTVSALLAEKGAVIVDADAITREVQQPGHQVFDAIVDRFGTGVVAADGTLDRAALASIVFADEPSRKDLEKIVHPASGRKWSNGCRRKPTPITWSCTTSRCSSNRPAGRWSSRA